MVPTLLVLLNTDDRYMLKFLCLNFAALSMYLVHDIDPATIECIGDTTFPGVLTYEIFFLTQTKVNWSMMINLACKEMGIGE